MSDVLHCEHIEYMCAATLAFVLTFMDRLEVFRLRWTFRALAVVLVVMALVLRPADVPLFLMFALVVARAFFSSFHRDAAGRTPEHGA